MKNLLALFFVSFSCSVFAANPSFQSFDTNYFSTAGNVIRPTGIVTNSIANLNGLGTNTTLNNSTNSGTTTFNGPQAGNFAGITNKQSGATLPSLVSTNMDIYGQGIAYNRGAMNIHGVSGQPDGAEVNIYGTGPTNAAFISYRAPAEDSANGSWAGDVGVWSDKFGAGYQAFVIDLYNTNTSLFGPDIRVNYTGNYAASGDTGLITHPALWGHTDALKLNFMSFLADSRAGTVGAQWDMLKGKFLDLKTASTNASWSQGYVTNASNGLYSTVKFTNGNCLAEMTVGTELYNSNNVFAIVVTTNNDNQVVVSTTDKDNWALTTGNVQINKPSFISDGLAATGKGLVVGASGRVYCLGPASTGGAFSVFNTANNNGWEFQAGNSSLLIHNYANNANSITVATNAPNGGFDVTAGGVKTTGTNSCSKLWVTGNAVIIGGVTNYYGIQTNDTPATAAYPAAWGAVATTTNGSLYVGSNGVWNLKL